MRTNAVVYLASASHFLAHFLELLVPALTMFIARDMGVEANSIIKAGFLLFLLYGVLALPWGYAADRYSCCSVLSVAGLLAGIGACLAAFSTTVTLLWLSLALVGVGIAAAHPAGMALITNSTALRGRALGTYGVWGNAGVLSAPLLGGILAYLSGWRFALIGAGILSLVNAALIFKYRHLELKNASEEKEPRKEAEESEADLGTFVWLCFVMILLGIVYRGNMVALPVLIEERGGALLAGISSSPLLTEAGKFFLGASDNARSFAASMLLSLIVLGGLYGQKFGGYVADRYNLQLSYIWFLSLGIPLLLLISLVEGTVLVLSASVFLFVSLGNQPIENSLVATLSTTRLRSRAYGLKFVLIFGVGSLAIWLVAMCREQGSTAAVYGWLSVIQLSAVLLCSAVFFRPAFRQRAISRKTVQSLNAPGTKVNLPVLQGEH